MRVAIVSQYFAPEPIPIPESLASALTRRGHDVRVLTGFPNYPAGRLYPGYRQRPRATEARDDYVVHRVPLLTNHSSRAVARALNYLSFSLSSLVSRRFFQQADVVYVYATPMTAAVAPDFWRHFGGAPVVLHIQDLWPESVTASSLVGDSGAGHLINSMLNPWLSGLYRRATAIISIAPTMTQLLVDRGVDEGKITTVLNWSGDEKRLLNTPLPQDRSRDSVTVTYAGNLGDHQGLHTAIAAAQRVAAEIPGFRLVIVGTGLAEGSLRRAAAHAHNVEVRGRVPAETMGAVYTESDFQLVSLRDLPIFRGTIPSKLQSTMAAGVPAIVAVPGDVSRLVASAGAGIVARPDDAESLASAFRAAAATTPSERRAMGVRAREAYLRTMAMPNGADQIESVLVRCARARPNLERSPLARLSRKEARPR